MMQKIQTKKVTILEGETLWQTLQKQGIYLPKSCGGKGICQNCQVKLAGLGKVASCRFCEPGIYEVELPLQEAFSIVGDFLKENKIEQGKSIPKGKLIVVIDLGTTTVAIKGITSCEEYHESFINPQREFGADVLSRIEASTSGKKTELQSIIKDRLNNTLEKMINQCKAEQVSVIVSGNTTMQHLLRGLSCEGLGKAPFMPVTLAREEEDWSIAHRKCQVTYLPGISTFVGGDIVSGIYGLGLHKKEGIYLLLDLGTNGEMALVRDGNIIVASAAAGPAFEGSSLSMKLHGAGIIRLLHYMVKENKIDEYGTLSDVYFEEGYPLKECQALTGVEGIADWKITQDEIREIQLAKAAIRAGIDVLLKDNYISASDVDEIYLAGGMGYYLEVEDAIGIGLLPKDFADKIVIAGNTSLMGGICYGKAVAGEDESKKEEALREMDEIAEEAREIRLSSHEEFEEKYIEYMNFWRENK